MLIVAFTIAALIAVIGGLFFAYLTYIAVKTFKVMYKNFLINQKQLVITMKQ